MSKLREKLKMYIDLYNTESASEQCEQITDDFAVKFYDWALGDGIDYAMKVETTQELQQYFKDNIYE